MELGPNCSLEDDSTMKTVTDLSTKENDDSTRIIENKVDACGDNDIRCSTDVSLASINKVVQSSLVKNKEKSPFVNVVNKECSDKINNDEIQHKEEEVIISSSIDKFESTINLQNLNKCSAASTIEQTSKDNLSIHDLSETITEVEIGNGNGHLNEIEEQEYKSLTTGKFDEEKETFSMLSEKNKRLVEERNDHLTAKVAITEDRKIVINNFKLLLTACRHEITKLQLKVNNISQHSDVDFDPSSSDAKKEIVSTVLNENLITQELDYSTVKSFLELPLSTCQDAATGTSPVKTESIKRLESRTNEDESAQLQPQQIVISKTPTRAFDCRPFNGPKTPPTPGVSKASPIVKITKRKATSRSFLGSDDESKTTASTKPRQSKIRIRSTQNEEDNSKVQDLSCLEDEVSDKRELKLSPQIIDEYLDEHKDKFEMFRTWFAADVARHNDVEHETSYSLRHNPHHDHNYQESRITNSWRGRGEVWRNNRYIRSMQTRPYYSSRGNSGGHYPSDNHSKWTPPQGGYNHYGTSYITSGNRYESNTYSTARNIKEHEASSKVTHSASRDDIEFYRELWNRHKRELAKLDGSPGKNTIISPIRTALREVEHENRLPSDSTHVHHELQGRSTKYSKHTDALEKRNKSSPHLTSQKTESGHRHHTIEEADRENTYTKRIRQSISPKRESQKLQVTSVVVLPSRSSSAAKLEHRSELDVNRSTVSPNFQTGRIKVTTNSPHTKRSRPSTRNTDEHNKRVASTSSSGSSNIRKTRKRESHFTDNSLSDEECDSVKKTSPIAAKAKIRPSETKQLKKSSTDLPEKNSMGRICEFKKSIPSRYSLSKTHQHDSENENFEKGHLRTTRSRLDEDDVDTMGTESETDSNQSIVAAGKSKSVKYGDTKGRHVSHRKCRRGDVSSDEGEDSEVVYRRRHRNSRRYEYKSDSESSYENEDDFFSEPGHFEEGEIVDSTEEKRRAGMEAHKQSSHINPDDDDDDDKAVEEDSESSESSKSSSTSSSDDISDVEEKVTKKRSPRTRRSENVAAASSLRHIIPSRRHEEVRLSRCDTDFVPRYKSGALPFRGRGNRGFFTSNTRRPFYTSSRYRGGSSYNHNSSYRGNSSGLPYFQRRYSSFETHPRSGYKDYGNSATPGGFAAFKKSRFNVSSYSDRYEENGSRKRPSYHPSIRSYRGENSHDIDMSKRRRAH